MRKSLFFCVAIANAWNGYYTVDSARGVEAEFQLDPYYSAADLVFNVDRSPVPRLKLADEASLYPYLMGHFFDFRTVLLEGSVYPMPILGAYVRSEQGSFYRRAQLSDGANLVRSLTEGFPEPWAASFFLGNVVHLVNDRDSVLGRGYAGLLASVGLWHLAWNNYVPSPWLEFEAKLKGAYDRKTEVLAWSFALGSKEYADDRIVDLLRLSLKRTRTDREGERGFSLVRNTHVELRGDLDRSLAFVPWHSWSNVLVQGTFLVGKKWPVSRGVWTLDLGLSWQGDVYHKELKEYNSEGWVFMFRPNFEF